MGTDQSADPLLRGMISSNLSIGFERTEARGPCPQPWGGARFRHELSAPEAAMPSILDKDFKYVPSHATNIRTTIRRVQAQMKRQTEKPKAKTIPLRARSRV